MATTLSATEAKRRLGEVINTVADDGAEVIVENHGQPRAAIIPIDAYEQFQQLRERARRAAAFDKLEQIRARVRQRNQDLTQEQAEALANRFVSEVVADMVAEGKIRFDPRE